MLRSGILIVEDSYIVAFHLQKTLESEGYNIVGIKTSGEAALELLEKQKADLVLMDIMLEGELDGIETAGIIQSKHHIPVIYITALTDKATIQRAKVTEPYGYLTKPFEDREIFTVIEMAIYKHQVESELRRSEERYFSTIRSISDAAIIFDQDFLVSYINPSAEAICGYTLKEAKDKSVFELLMLKDTYTGIFPVNPVQCDLDPTHSNAMPKGLVLIAKNGREKPIGEGSISPILNYRGELLGLIIIFKDITDRIARETLQKDIDKQRLAAMLEGQENERSRIAKDLHDGLGQMLNAIKMNVRVAVPDDEHALSLFSSIDDAIQETVRISENLLPAKLRDFDLVTCIKSLCNQIMKSSNVPINFESLDADYEISQSQKINLYRVAQEALNNAIRHSGASQIAVQLIMTGGKVQLSVEDDGTGIHNKTKVNGTNGVSMKHGLGNMRDRAEIMGGKLIVESDQNRGTLIIVEVPFKKSIANAEVQSADSR